MKNFSIHSLQILLLWLIFYGIGATSIHAQDLNQKLAELRSRYNNSWGSMYLTYNSITDILNILSKPEKRKIINEEHGENTVLLLHNFLQQNRGPSINRSIAIVEIDLNIMQIGYVKVNSINGTITQIQWSWEDKVRIAVLCDRLILGVYTAQTAYEQLSNPQTAATISIEKGVSITQAIYDDPYISSENANLALSGLRVLLENKPKEFETLSQTNKDLYSKLSGFKTSFDALLSKKEINQLKTNKQLSDEFVQDLKSRRDGKSADFFQDLEKSSAYVLRPGKSQNDFQLQRRRREPPVVILKEEPDNSAKFNAELNTEKARRTDGWTPRYIRQRDWIDDKNLYSKSIKLNGKIREKVIADGFNLTITSIEKEKQIGADMKAQSGFTLLSVEMTIENTSNGDFFIQPFLVALKDLRNYRYAASAFGKEPVLKIPDALRKGEKITGWITFEVLGNAKDFVLIAQTLRSTPVRISIVLE